MKPILSAFLLCTAVAVAAQDYYGSARPPGAYGYNGYDRLVPPLPVPGYSVGTTQSVVTRRIIGSPRGYEGYGDPDAVVTTRRLVAPQPVPRFAPAAPVIIEERRVETIRRVLRPGADWLE
jgi:hypothetical protein